MPHLSSELPYNEFYGGGITNLKILKNLLNKTVSFGSQELKSSWTGLSMQKWEYKHNVTLF